MTYPLPASVEIVALFKVLIPVFSPTQLPRHCFVFLELYHINFNQYTYLVVEKQLTSVTKGKV